jgi:tetratricopeptide (TPR) repeat protein
MRSRLLLLALLAVGVTAAAPVAAGPLWRDVAKGDLRRRNAAVEEGNLHLREARDRRDRLDRGAPTRTHVFDPARAALAAYERALAIGPADAEIHYRALAAAKLVADDSGICHACRDGYEAMIRHIDALRKLDPLDTREVEYAWEMSVALSKLGALGGPQADGHFTRAIEEYERWRRLVDETDPQLARALSTCYSNAAELLMAVGRLDEAIAQYQTAIELNPIEPLGYFGLAVAYDRDGQWNKAVAAMTEGLNRPPALARLEDREVFFVPEGEIYYYYALAHHVMGADPALVSAEYTRFLSRARGSKYAARAREHLAEMSRGAPAGALP